MKKAIFNWSGGKDSALALHKVLTQNDYEVHSLLTSLNHETQRISMHGVRLELLRKQAKSIGLTLHTFSLPATPNNSAYEEELKQAMNSFKKQGIDYSVFGDINLEDLRKYREERTAKINMQAVFPLWQQSTSKLVEQFIGSGFKAIVTAVDASKLSKSFVGRIIDYDFINELPLGVDPAGENGEFHSFVFDGPIFKEAIQFEKGEIVHKFYSKDDKHGFYFCDLI
jgi:uncharacterized protein (TIGR00290 family)